MKKLSVIVPCFNEQESLPIFFKEINKISKEMDYIDFEFIFIDDGSKDKTVQVINELRNNDKRIRYISFSRNFGKEAAIFAGLEYCTGDYVALMDADLQDPPYLLNKMYNLISEKKYDCIATRRSNRKGEPIIKSIFAKCFYRIINKISKIDLVDGARDYRLMSRKMVDSILKIKEYNRFSKGIFGWVGFNTKWIEYENIERVAGKTKWSFWKLFLYSLEGIVAFSTAPLAIASILGFVFCVTSFFAICFIIIRQLIFGGSAYGWSSMICIFIFASGIQLFCTGIVGQYLSKTYLETKNRPLYIVKNTERDID